jgi:hypothetical protein
MSWPGSGPEVMALQSVARYRFRVKAEKQSCGSAVEATNRSRAQQLSAAYRSVSGLSYKRQ